ncbi:MAG: YceI family protein [Nocardiopsaceae bacterium]|nr:YceI family protein [Nocardiopsaceae bacterium]
MTEGLTARLRSKDGWAVRGAVLTVTDLTGQQAARADGDNDGLAATGPLPPGMYTAIVMAPGFEPSARTVMIPASGSATLGTVTLSRSAVGAPLPPPGKWTVDPVHSAVTLTARHLGMASISGTIGEFSATIEIAEPVEESTVRAVLKADSLSTGSKMRDDHLRSADFMDVSRFPEIGYEGTSVTPVDGERWTVEGTLTLHGESRSVPLDLIYLGTGPDPWGGTRAAFRATTELKREDFSVSWNESLPGGIAMIGSVVQITLDVEAVQGDLPPMPDA